MTARNLEIKARLVNINEFEKTKKQVAFLCGFKCEEDTFFLNVRQED